MVAKKWADGLRVKLKFRGLGLIPPLLDAHVPVSIALQHTGPSLHTGVPVAIGGGASKSHSSCEFHLSCIDCGWPCSFCFLLVLPGGPGAGLCQWTPSMRSSQLILPPGEQALENNSMCHSSFWNVLDVSAFFCISQELSTIGHMFLLGTGHSG